MATKKKPAAKKPASGKKGRGESSSDTAPTVADEAGKPEAPATDGKPKRITVKQLTPLNRSVASLNDEFRDDANYLLEVHDGKFARLLIQRHHCAMKNCDSEGTILDLHRNFNQPLFFVPSELTCELLRGDENWGDVQGKMFCLKTQESVEQMLKKGLAAQLVADKKAKDIHEGLKMIGDRMKKGAQGRILFFYVALRNAAIKVSNEIQSVAEDGVKVGEDSFKRALSRMRI